MAETNESRLPTDLASIAEHAKGRLSFTTERHLRRLAAERKIIAYRLGGKLLISASEVEALITPRSTLSG